MRRLWVLACSGWLVGFNTLLDTGGNGDIVWTTSTVPITIHQDGSDNLAPQNAINAVLDAMAVWGQPACSDWQFTDAGRTTTGGDAMDGANRVSWQEGSFPSANAIAVTTRHINSGPNPDVIVEGDVRLNGRDYAWAIQGAIIPDRHDIHSAVAHELGHVLGLQHSANPEATMFWDAQEGVTALRSLHNDDINGLCFLYPNAAFSCASDDECPVRADELTGNNAESTFCDMGGSCSIGPAGLFQECFGPANCFSNVCFDANAANSYDPLGYCSTSTCMGPGDCNGNYCGGSVAFCNLGHDDCATHADCTGANHFCARDLDGRRRCLRTCLNDSHCTLLPGSICDGFHMPTGTAGFCRIPGPSGSNVPCNSGLDCQTLRCIWGGPNPTCSQPMPPMGGDGNAADGNAGDGNTVGGDSMVMAGDTNLPPGSDGNTMGGDTRPPAGGDFNPRPGDRNSPFFIPPPPGGNGDPEAGCECQSTSNGLWLVVLGVPFTFRRRTSRSTGRH